MKSTSVKTIALFATLGSSTAFPLGLELEFGSGIGKDQIEPRSSSSDGTTSNAEIKKFQEELFGNVVFGFRLDPRLLILHDRTLHLSGGAGFGWERGSGSASLEGLKEEYTLSRFILEPNARFVYFPARNFGLGLGMGYYFTLTGSFARKRTMASAVEEEKQDLDENGGLRMRFFSSFVMPGSNQPQLTAGYQFTATGSFKTEKATEKLDLSGHSFVLSYVHPIIFSNSNTDSNDEYDDRDSRGRRRASDQDDRNQRRRKQRPR